ncbi:MAG TPA: GGDEF domain-containing protein [Dokdonella sp.]|uniref:GGDEF domain-containing protein n=1 Tax=Dokdonella sp. TaxID=2291710 RepID=UPI002D7F67CB|nr:GGDEF domain-containing protein [Dokdonella sp.]HET9032516.1 GGDEF domain-containing protein [Dokdonella sp.]
MSMVSLPLLAAPLLNGVALLLALGFRRNRAVMILAILTCIALALAGVIESASNAHSVEAVRMFGPWLLLVAAAMPERRLLAGRNLLLFILLAIAILLTLTASPHVWFGLRGVLPLGWLPWSSGAVAASLVLLASAVCLLRWLILELSIESALSVVLVLAAIAMLPALRAGAANDLLALGGVISIIAILRASYRMAFVDGLSDVPNRRALDEALSRISGDYALAMVDVDHFKQFNDRHGHDAGDRVLASVAQLLKTTRGAQAYRYGGEEFCLLFTGSRVRDARQACEEVRRAIEKMRVQVRSTRSAAQRTSRSKSESVAAAKVTVSIGLALRDDKLRSAEDVLKAADKALYKAKAKGRNLVVPSRSGR